MRGELRRGEARHEIDSHTHRETKLRAGAMFRRRRVRRKRIDCARVRLSTAMNQLRIPTGAVLRAERARVSERNVEEERGNGGGEQEGKERDRQPEREARRSEERGREKGKEEREREREKQIGARSSGKREQTTWSNSVFTSRAVRGSRGHVLIGSWPATGRCTLYVVVVDDGCSGTVSRRDSRGQDSSPSVWSAGFSVETANGARPTMAMMTFGALVALGRPFPLISLIDILGSSTRCRSARANTPLVILRKSSTFANFCKRK